jgi:hypothetical protein
VRDVFERETQDYRLAFLPVALAGTNRLGVDDRQECLSYQAQEYGGLLVLKK